MTTAHTEADAHHPGYAVYVKVWATLVVLTAITVLASQVNLRHLAVFAAVLIASVKSSLVLLYFMHLKYEKRVFAYMFVAAFATFVIFMILTFADYAFR